MDFITGLPGNIIETILIGLPLRDAVRTSILAKKWRYAWATIPKLVFDDKLCVSSTVTRQPPGRFKHIPQFSRAILQVLLLHKGPILEVSLVIDTVQRCSEIDQSILFLSRNSVENFTLIINKGEDYKLPSSFFSFSRLMQLHLDSCVFKPPPTFKGFTLLTSLVLDEVKIAAEVLHGLISSCPLVESLTILSSEVISYKKFVLYKMNTPRLKYLHVDYSFSEEVVEEDLEGRNVYFRELFDFLSVTLEDLNMSYGFIKDLAIAAVPKILPKTLLHLKYLTLHHICFEDLNDAYFALCLIRSCPNLKTIDFKMFALEDGVARHLQPLDFSGISLNQLVEVRMEDFTGVQSEMDFMNFILATSPVLVTMLINPHPEKVIDNGLKILKQISKFPRVSPLAKVIYEDEPSSK